MKFTPGPWQAKQENEYCPAQVFAGDYGRPIADVFGNDRQERADNAKLIAVAPTLLEALAELNETAEQYLEKQSVDTINRFTAALRHARAAIAKAEGR